MYADILINGYKIHINGYWITIKKNERVIWKKEPTNRSWLDTEHALVAQDLDKLQSTIVSLINQQERKYEHDNR